MMLEFGVKDDAPAVRLTVDSYSDWSERPLDVCPVWVDISDPGNPISHTAGPCVPAPDYDLAVTVTLTATDMGGLARHGARVRLPAEAPAYRGPNEAGGYWGMWCYLGWVQHFYHVWPFWSTPSQSLRAGSVRQSVIAPGSDGDACPPETINGGGHGVNGDFAVPRPVGAVDSGGGGELQSAETVITRLTYFFGGQAVAVRVAGDTEYPANNGLFYLHTEDPSRSLPRSSAVGLGTSLGSTSGLTYGVDAGQPHPAAGDVVPGSAGLFLPYGEYRQRPVTHPDVTDTGFTGHRHNDDIGLVYMNARYYVAGIGRFASADPNLSVRLIPEPGAAIGYNRYAYANLNPVAYSDPSGHLSIEEIETYFGYSVEQLSDLHDALAELHGDAPLPDFDELSPKEQMAWVMRANGWRQDLVSWLLHEDTHFGDIFAYESDGATGLAMLALFETSHAGSATYAGGFYGLDGAYVGQEIRHQAFDVIDGYALSAQTAEAYYAGNYDALPRLTGSDGRNYWDPVMHSKLTKSHWGPVIAAGSGAALLATCASNPVGWVACAAGSGAGLLSSSLTVAGIAHAAWSPPEAVNYPLLRIPLLTGNAPHQYGFRPPHGHYE